MKVPALSLLLCATSALATPVDSYAEAGLEERQQTTPENCATGIHMIVGPGKGHAAKNGLLQGLINQVKKDVSGSNARTIKYQPTEHPIPEARPRFARYVKTYAASCPNTPIALIGYSTGGIIIMDTLCGASENIGSPTQPISPKYTNNIIAASSYGEETWRANQPYDVKNDKTCPTDAPSFPRQNTAACKPYDNIIQSYCDNDDGECCTGAIGGPEAHKLYQNEYNSDVANYINNAYKKYRLTHPQLPPGIPTIPGVPAVPGVPTVNGLNLQQLATDTGFGPLH